MAGAEGFEPPKAVLETAGLPLAYAPNLSVVALILLGLPMRLMLAAVRAELLHLQTFSRSSLILRLAVVSVFTLAARELNNFSRH
jgi:hypothetical protein